MANGLNLVQQSGKSCHGGVMKTRNISMDVLRALAAMQTIGYHLGLFNWMGSLGVDLFFVLSGFFISGILFADIRKYGTLRLGQFWTNRAFKILPPLLVICGVVLLVLQDVKTLHAVENALLFCTDYRGGSILSHTILSHTWSLSVEEQFYLCLPVLLIAMRKRMDYLPWVYVAVVIGTFFLRLQPHYGGDGAFHVRADNLMTGVMIRWILDFRPVWFNRVARWSLLPGLMCLLPAWGVFHWLNPVHSFMFTLIDLTCGSLVVWCYANDKHWMWSTMPSRWLAAVGMWSYSIYLWQQPVVSFMMGKGVTLVYVDRVVITFALSLLIGWFMYGVVEVPAQRLRLCVSQIKSGKTSQNQQERGIL